MKIGYLLQAGVPEIRARYLSGAANHVRQTFNELSNLGHHLCLLANFDGQIWKSIDLKQFEPVPVRWLDQGGFRKFEKIIRRIQADLRLPYLALFESLKFAQVCRQELSNFDLFYERMGWMGYGGGMASRLLGIPLIFEVNGDHLSEMEMLGVAPKGLQRYLSIALMKRAVRRTTHVVATGEGWRQQFINQWKYPSHKITVIENGSEVVNLLARDQLRSFQPHDKLTDPTIIYIGGFEPWHGVTILIRAFAKLIAEKDLAQLVLMGTGSELANIEQLIHNCALEEYVTLTGQLSVEQSAGYLAMSDIGVSPYCGRVEYSGLKLLD
jgi:glycosyltransferase involved in cell wall biosynthesis